MNKKFKQNFVQIGLTMMMTFAVAFQSFAANAKIAFSDPAAEVGETVDVTMKFTSTSEDVLGNTDVMLSYDANMLEYTGGSENASGGAGAIRVTSGMEGKKEIVTSLQFKALQAGNTKITVASWEGYDEAGQMLTMDKEGSSAVTITAPATYSTDAALTSLQISPGTLEPAFSAEVENYTTSVGLDTDRLTVSAQASSDKATVTVEGGDQLQEGQNSVVCKVTAEDGTTVRNYTILVNKTEGGANEVQPETTVSSLDILAELEASKTPLKIGITALPEGVAAPAGLKESSITIGETKVQGWIPEVEGQPEYCVFYGVSGSGTAGFYCYDRTDKTIQRYFAETADQATASEYTDVTERYNSLVDDYGKLRMIAIGAGILTAVLLIFLIIILVSRGKTRGAKVSKEPDENIPEKASGRSAGKKMTKEERYMLGEEDEYSEPEGPLNKTVPAEDVERTIAVRLAQEAAAATTDIKASSTSVQDEDDDDFEVFDLNDEQK